MEARPQSEACQDLDSKFTPIRYDEIRHIAGESNARQQINVPTVNGRPKMPLLPVGHSN